MFDRLRVNNTGHLMQELECGFAALGSVRHCTAKCGAVLAAGSHVTKSVMFESRVVGVPALSKR
jgi:hypothetical protein